ncbi:amino acid ABC transporter substrate-binding protein [Agrobacterium tumefaciens]|uniref:amino acid ABC transporter substrate-binding protein n=1 Tax=Agrobacterium tumefaciens TaxID=358 RepID=UPI00287C3C15|nr:amino acid ABC transporter substrate-binding protein [Agrobacterium tumefaciens]MDS7594792.1 amino acid ABC transporter substrate-binding protein [Agrobacterium tumefaciens]
MTILKRRTLFCLLSGIAVSAITPSLTYAEDRKSVKIGYAVSKSGANATGAGITTIPNYKLWVKEVNDAGGLTLPDGSRLPIEVVEYDDRSSAEDAVRSTERLASQDKVDFLLPPWGTGFNLAVAPLYDRFGYPQLAVTGVTDKAPEFAARWKKSFWMLGGGHDYANSLAGVLKAARDTGQINDKVAVISVADGFGIDLIKAARPALKEAGFTLAYDKTYPVGTSDFAALVNEAAASGADSFIAFSYPPDSFAVTKQAQTNKFNPKVFYVGVGGAFPIFPKVSDGKHEGVISIGGVDGTSDKIADYFKRHEAFIGAKPDSWASAITYASLEMLAQSVKRVGLDKAAVAEELSTGEFDTVIGPVKLEDNQLRQLWWAGQWQGDRFVAIAPSDRTGAAKPVVPKPDW